MEFQLFFINQPIQEEYHPWQGPLGVGIQQGHRPPLWNCLCSWEWWLPSSSFFPQIGTWCTVVIPSHVNWMCIWGKSNLKNSHFWHDQGLCPWPHDCQPRLLSTVPPWFAFNWILDGIEVIVFRIAWNMNLLVPYNIFTTLSAICAEFHNSNGLETLLP